MKGDIDLCRSLLQHVEDQCPEVSRYKRRLKIGRLTWADHEFLEAARNETFWKKAKGTVKEKTGGLSFELLKQMLLQLPHKAKKRAGSLVRIVRQYHVDSQPNFRKTRISQMARLSWHDSCMFLL